MNSLSLQLLPDLGISKNRLIFAEIQILVFWLDILRKLKTIINSLFLIILSVILK